MIKHVFIFLTLFWVNNLNYAQESIHKNPFWLNVAVGGSSKHLNAGASYNKTLENISYQISINAIAEDILSKSGMTTANVGIGFANCKDWLISSVHLGPSLSYGSDFIKPNEHTYFWGAGLAINLQSYFMPLHNLFPGVGLGVELFYNFNAFQTKDVNYKNVYAVRIGVCLTNIHMK